MVDRRDPVAFPVEIPPIEDNVPLLAFFLGKVIDRRRPRAITGVSDATMQRRIHQISDIVKTFNSTLQFDIIHVLCIEVLFDRGIFSNRVASGLRRTSRTPKSRASRPAATAAGDRSAVPRSKDFRGPESERNRQQARQDRRESSRPRGPALRAIASHGTPPEMRKPSESAANDLETAGDRRSRGPGRNLSSSACRATTRPARWEIGAIRQIRAHSIDASGASAVKGILSSISRPSCDRSRPGILAPPSLCRSVAFRRAAERPDEVPGRPGQSAVRAAQRQEDRGGRGRPSRGSATRTGDGPGLPDLPPGTTKKSRSVSTGGTGGSTPKVTAGQPAEGVVRRYDPARASPRRAARRGEPPRPAADSENAGAWILR